MGLFNFLSPKPRVTTEANAAIRQVLLMAFPGGPKQIEEETTRLHSFLRGKLTKEDSGNLLRKIKVLLIISPDKSESRITASIIGSTNGKLTPEEAHNVYVHLTGISGNIISGGNGASAEQAIVINANSSILGVPEEYAYVERVCGTRKVDSQRLINLNDKHYDVLAVTIKDGSARELWFDITSFFGKFD